jgi:dihydroorotase
MTASLLIVGGTVIDPASNQENNLDIRISGDTIIEKGKSLKQSGDEIVIDAKGLWITPGFIDIHTHLRDLGQKDKEDISSGTKAAAAGGYTTIVAMANTLPPIDNSAILSLLLNRIAEHAQIEVLPVACVTKNMEGAELTNMSELADLGAIAFSDDGLPISNMAVLKRALEYAKLVNRPLISHAEDKDLACHGIIHEGVTSTKMGLKGIPSAAETAAIARELEIVRATHSPYHFTHVSCANSVNLIRQAKKDGLPVTADVTPHHITLTTDNITAFDTAYKMRPPLRESTDREALLLGIRDGTIDAIATDHAPHTSLEKAGTMDEASVGLIGLETAFSLCFETLVKTNYISRLHLIKLLTYGPAQVMNLPIPTLDSGYQANITIVDPDCNWNYDVQRGFSRSHNTPFHGRSMTSKIAMTIYNGTTVYKDDNIIDKRCL